MRVYEFDFNESEADGTHCLHIHDGAYAHGKEVPAIGERVALDGRYDTAPIVEGVVVRHEKGARAHNQGITFVYVQLDWDTAKR